MSWIAHRIAYLVAPWRDLSDVQADLARHDLIIHHLKENIMAAQIYADRLNTATDAVAAQLAQVRAEFAALREGLDADKAAAVDAALAHLDEPIARLEAMGRDDDNPLPDDGKDGVEDELAGDPDLV